MYYYSLSKPFVVYSVNIMYITNIEIIDIIVPNFSMSFGVAQPEPEAMAICAIAGGVANAKEAPMPIIMVYISALSWVPAAIIVNIIGITKLYITVVVTILLIMLVNIIDNEAINRTIILGFTSLNSGCMTPVIAAVMPISEEVIYLPRAKVQAHSIILGQLTPWFIASLKFNTGSWP